MEPFVTTPIKLKVVIREDGVIETSIDYDANATPDDIAGSKMLIMMHMLVESLSYILNQEAVELPPDLTAAIIGFQSELSRHGID